MEADMKQIGLSDRFLAEATLYPELYVGRVFSQHRDVYKVMCESGELTAEVSGKLRFDIRDLSDYPAVGDFVMLDRNTNTNGNAIIHNILSRKSAFIRKAAGTSNDNQAVASNIDTVFICMSLNNDFNLRRVERYLSIAWDSGAVPVIVLTKSDLSDEVEQRLEEVNSVAIGVDVLVTSSLQQDGYLQVLPYIKEGQTIAFIGSSGVGKSTLINRLLGQELMATREIREDDDKGKHTTTHRQLILLPNGGIVLDTPGMRELGVFSGNLSTTFEDIAELAAGCKFGNCSHGTEPDCAVQGAIVSGALSRGRFENYQKLQREMSYEGLNSRQLENEKIRAFGWSKKEIKQFKDHVKSKRHK